MSSHRRHHGFPLLIATLVLLAFMLACRYVPGLASLWLKRFIQPVSRLSRRVPAPFPLLEPLALLTTAAVLAMLLRLRWRSVLRLGFTILAGYLLLWYPAYWARPVEPCPMPTASQLEWLCQALIDTLDTSPLEFPSDILSEAPAAAGLPDAAVKAARYPEWMRAFHLAGLYAPWTGEAIVDPGAPSWLVPFTAVHELMHMKGIADEGEANIAAWCRCLERGGAFADSARLWALRYAMGLLNKADPTARDTTHAGMSRRLADVYTCVGGDCDAASSSALGVLRMADFTTSYEALVGWLIQSEQIAGSAMG